MIRRDGVRAWTNAAALDELVRLASGVTEGCIVEVGVREGGTLRAMAEAATVPCYGVDAWGLANYADPGDDAAAERVDLDTFATACRNVDGRAALMRSLSRDAARHWDAGPIGLLHVDAEHTEAAVLADFAVWSEHLLPGAIVTFDDYKPKRWPGVVAAVDALAASGKVEALRFVGNRLAVTRVA